MTFTLLIGMYRNKQSLVPVQYYNKLPKECNVNVAIILEPVIATGEQLVVAVLYIVLIKSQLGCNN